MKYLSVIIAAIVLVFGSIASPAANPDRISTATGVPVATLQAERASTGLGWGDLEKAHLLANATGQSFDNVVALHKSGQGWGKIAQDHGLNLGTLVSNANSSNNAAKQAKAAAAVHGRSRVHFHHSGNSTTRGSSGSHGMHSMGHMSAPHGMGHGGGHHR